MATAKLRKASDFEQAKQYFNNRGLAVRHNPYYPLKLTIYLAKQKPMRDLSKAEKLASERALFYEENCPVSVIEAKQFMRIHNVDCTIGHFLFQVFLEYYRLGKCEYAEFLIFLSTLDDMKCNHCEYKGNVPQFMSH